MLGHDGNTCLYWIDTLPHLPGATADVTPRVEYIGATYDLWYGLYDTDVYLIRAGEAQILDGIADSAGDDNILRFGAGIKESSLGLGLVHGYLSLRVGDTPGDVLAERTIKRFEFADGS